MRIAHPICVASLLWTVACVADSAADDRSKVGPAAVSSGGEDQRLLVCALMRNGNAEIVLVREDGTEVKQLTKNRVKDTRPAWSPDGKRIVFSSRDDIGQGLFVMDADGRNVRRLTYGSDAGAAWSPDGKMIAYTHHDRRMSGHTSIRVAYLKTEDPAGKTSNRIDTSVPIEKNVEITDSSCYTASPTWSPDSKTIAFGSNRTGPWRVYAMDPDGKNIRDISKTDNRGGNVYPSWSPDGKRIAYTEQVADRTRQIHVIDADGKNKRQLTKDGDFNCYPTWSPDSKKIAYMTFPTSESQGSLAIVDAERGESEIFFREQGIRHIGRPAWKPR